MARGGGGELLLAGEFELDRPAGLQGRQHDDVLDQHFLLGAEAAADALAEHAHLGGIEIEDARELDAGEERHLRARAHVERSIAVEPGNGGVGFQMRVLHARSEIGAFVNGVGLGKAGFDVADAAMHLAP